MTPVIQMALVGLLWALSVSIVVAVSTYCTCWVMRVVDDRKAIEVEELLARLETEREIQNGSNEEDGVL